MRLNRLTAMESHHINVTPLIDVVMCLIVFFLLVGHIARQAAVRGVRVPVALHGKTMLDKSGQLIINVVPQASDVPGVAGRPRIEIWSQTVTFADLPALLTAYARRNPGLKLVLRADRSIPYRYIAPVLAACAQAGIGSVHFMTRRPS